MFGPFRNNKTWPKKIYIKEFMAFTMQFYTDIALFPKEILI